MKTSFAHAGIGAALIAFIGGTAPSHAQSAAQLYPYCALRAGSASCYHMTLDSCGKACIANPAYLGEARARPLRAAIAGPAVAGERATPMPRVRKAASATRRIGVSPAGIDAGARASAAGSGDFAGWPTDFLTNRFGDRQSQGRP